MKIVKFGMVGVLLGFLISCSDSNKEVELQYAKEDLKSIKYELTLNMASEAYMNDQPMSAEYEVKFPFVLNSAREGDAVNSEITISNIDAKVIFASGQQSIDTRNLKNIKLDFNYSTSGNEKTINPEIDSLVIDFGEMLGGTLDWDYIFNYITPNFPDKKVAIGDSWNDTLRFNKIEAGSRIKVDLLMSHKLEGYEEVNGKECAVIKTQINSTLDQSFELMGGTWDIEGEISGTMTTNFDFNLGIIENLIVNENSKGEVKAQSGDMSATYTQTVKLELKLVE